MNKNAYFLKKHNKVFYKNCPSLLLGYFMFMDTIKDIKLCKSLDFKSSNHLNDKEMQKKTVKNGRPGENNSSSKTSFYTLLLGFLLSADFLRASYPECKS